MADPYFRGTRFGTKMGDPNDEFHPVNILRDWICDLDSEDYRLKMEIVDEFARQGVDYWATEIREDQLRIIKNTYPDSWEEYIKVY